MALTDRAKVALGHREEYRKTFLAELHGANATNEKIVKLPEQSNVVLSRETADKYGIPFHEVTIPDIASLKKISGVDDTLFEEGIYENKYAEIPNWKKAENQRWGTICYLLRAYVYGNSKLVSGYENLLNESAFPMKFTVYGDANTDIDIPANTKLELKEQGLVQYRTVTLHGNAQILTEANLELVIETLTRVSANSNADVNSGSLVNLGTDGGVGGDGGPGGRGGDGASGGTASNATDGQPGQPGALGGNGKAAVDCVYTINNITSPITVGSVGGNGGKGGSGGKGGNGGNGGDAVAYSENGGNGGNGAKGGDGGNGGDAGAGGEVKVYFKTGGDLISITGLSAKGGDGGAGGSGGTGGTGGSGTSSSGSAGQAGIAGKSGTAGIGANSGKVTITQLA